MARRSRALEIIMAMDTSGVSAGMRRVSNETGQFGRTATQGARATDRLRSSLGRAAIAAGSAAAAYISVAQAREAIVTTQELALATRGLERNLGIATKQASRWAAVTRARGVDSKALTMGFTSLSRAIEGAKDGAETSLKPFQALGISQKELAATGGNFSKQVLLIADALGKAEGSSTRQAAAAKLLGRGYQTILPMFTEGAKGLQEQLRWADEFGATMGTDTVDAMNDFTTAQRRSKVAVMGLQIAFAKFATPAITEALERFGQFVRVINSGALTRAEKLSRLRAEFEKLRDFVLRIVNDLAPQIAQAAGEIGVQMAKAMARGFVETGLLGKAAIATFLIANLGGPRAIVGAGRTAGAFFSTGFAQSAAGVQYAQGAAFSQMFDRTNASRMQKAFTAPMLVGSAFAAKSIASSLISSLARMIPMVAATFAIGDVLLTAIAGDIKGAAFKGGGAAIGAALGGVIGSILPGVGTVLGAGLGAGLGAIGGNLIKGITEGAKAETPTLRKQLQTSAREAAQAARRGQGAAQAAEAFGRMMVEARRNQTRATNRVEAAESRLANARRQYGASSRQAAQAERDLAAAKRGVVRANLRVQETERLQGVARRGQMVYLRQEAGAQKASVEALQSRRQELQRGLVPQKGETISRKTALRLGREMAKVDRQLGEAKGRLARVYAQAGQQIGPKFSKNLRETASVQLRFNRGIINLREITRTGSLNISKSFGVIDKSARNAGRGSKEFADETGKQTQRAKKSVQSLPGPVGTSLNKTTGHFERSANFISSFRPGNFQAKRRGGLIFRDEGTSRNGLVPVKVAPGEMVAYKGRSMIVPGSNDKKDSVGMMLPVGSQVFTYHGQELLARGFSPKQALEKQVPHFATGGLVRPRITGGTPKGREVGNAAIDRTRGIAWSRLKTIYKAAKKMFAGGPGVTRSYPGLSGDTDFVPALGWMLSDLARSTVGNISVTSGYRSYAEQAALFAANPNPRMVAPPGRSNHQQGIAADISPQRPSYGGRERRSGLVFPMSWEPWHIELDGTPKFPALGNFVAKGYNKGGWVKTGYTVFDDSGGGYLGHLQQGNGYAELGTATKGGVATGMGYIAQALGIPGELADKFPLDVKINGRTKRMYKRDRGYGQGTPDYSIDIYKDTWRYFGLNGNSKGTASIRPAATKKQMEEMQGKADDVLGRVRKSRRNGGSRGFLKAAKKNAVKARKMAGRGNIWGAGDRLDKAREQIKKANQNRTKTGGNNNKSGGGSRRLPNLPNLKDLPASVRSLIRSPGINVEDALLIYDRAATLAEVTKSTKDDEAVRRGRIALQSSILQSSLRTARRRSAFLRTFNKDDKKFGGQTIAELKAIARNKDASKEDRKAAKKTLAQINKAKSSRSTALSNAATAQSELASLRGKDETAAEDTSAADLAQAMKDLAAAIKEQNQMQASVQAVSSREALKMLSDVISGQIVGKRAAVTNTPTGVRY